MYIEAKISVTSEDADKNTCVESSYESDPFGCGKTGFIPSRIFGHPVGIFGIAMVEMWERFSYYGMKAELVLYFNTKLFLPGRWQSVLGVSVLQMVYGIPDDEVSGEDRVELIQSLSSQTYGLYTALCYLLPLLGGFLADRYFGTVPMLYLGCTLIALGHFFMVFHHTVLLALVLIALGTGFFKPNAATLVGRLYSPDDGALRDSGFSIFYCAVNAGAFLAPLVCGSFRSEYGFGVAFAVSGIGMLFALFAFSVADRLQLFRPPGFDPRSSAPVNGTNQESHAKAQKVTEGTSETVQQSLLAAEDAQSQRARLMVIGFACLMSVAFWSVYEQGGNTMPLFVEESVDRSLGAGWEVPTEFFQSINPLFILVFTPLLAMYWQRSSLKSSSSSEDTPDSGTHNSGSQSLNKMAIASCLVCAAYTMMFFIAAGAGEGQKVCIFWMLIFIATMTVGELYLSPVGLSFISQVSPAHMTSQMMGCWSLAASMGNYIAGFVGSYYSEIPHSTFFMILATVAGFNGLTMLALSHPLQNLLNSSYTRTSRATSSDT